MNLLEIVLTGISLAGDAFTISICKGLNNPRKKNAIIVALYFGLFQFLMPIIGYYLGNVFSERIINFNPYISTILLIVIGILMIKSDDNLSLSSKLSFKEMILLSIATSIDALVIGISFSFLNVKIISSSIIIGIITFIMCFFGFLLGHIFNKKVGTYSNLVAGSILIILGIKIFVENIL